MSRDSVIDEVRAIRDAIASEHNYDLAAICRAIRERSRAAGVQTVTLSPRPASPPAELGDARDVEQPGGAADEE